MAYKAIDQYGVIGDMHSIALVGIDGSIDWCCLPYFDSPSLFAAILDDRKGGRFQIASTNGGNRKQMYIPETNVLVTRFLEMAGVGEVTDFMPITHDVLGETSRKHQIIRIVRCVRGAVQFRMDCLPAFDYAREAHETHVEGNCALFATSKMRVGLTGTQPLRQEGTGVASEFTLREGESATFVLRYFQNGEGSELLRAPLPGDEVKNDTLEFWRRWLSRCSYDGRWREMMLRSALVLKLLTFQPTGAIVAAPTTSLPEQIGSVRNWDYRYTWIRDAAFTIYAFMRLGFVEEAAQFMDWLHNRVSEQDDVNGPLNIMYGIFGNHDLPEECLHHLDGYRGSRPVRIGNAASTNIQLDIYGELMDSIYLHDKYGTPIYYEQWAELRRMLDWVSKNWERADESIWEVRGGPQQFVYSKLQCWVALDRGLRLAQKRSLPIDREAFLRERDRIYERIQAQGWSEKRQSYVQMLGSDALDASTLMMPLVLFSSPTDPRMLKTIDAIMNGLVKDSLVHRYDTDRGADDGLPGAEGTFSICTFWLVEALTRAGRIDESRLIFEKMLTYANHLGLYSEEIGLCGEALGNFPQALTHLGLISAAYNLDRTLSGGHHVSIPT